MTSLPTNTSFMSIRPYYEYDRLYCRFMVDLCSWFTYQLQRRPLYWLCWHNRLDQGVLVRSLFKVLLTWLKLLLVKPFIIALLPTHLLSSFSASINLFESYAFFIRFCWLYCSFLQLVLFSIFSSNFCICILTLYSLQYFFKKYIFMFVYVGKTLCLLNFVVSSNWKNWFVAYIPSLHRMN